MSETNINEQPEARPVVACSDLLAGYSSRHWTYGGTGITNFDAKQLEQYQAAIMQHGDKDMKVSDVPMTDTGYEGLMSLHDMKGRRDLSSFWNVFQSLKPANDESSDRESGTQRGKDVTD